MTADDLPLETLAPEAAARLSQWLRDYAPPPGAPDELFDASGRPSLAWLKLLSHYAEYPVEEFNRRFGLATRHIRETGVSYRIFGEENERIWPLNSLPLILTPKDWRQIVEGVTQRFQLMEALLADLYGEAKVVTEGLLPAAAIAGARDYIRAMRGVKPPGGRHLHHFAVDLGRGPDGRWWVLNDRSQSPSGAGYALENRLVLSRAFSNLYDAMQVQRLASFFDGFRASLSATSGRADPRMCLLTAGRFSETYFEQAHIARYLGLLLVEGDDLVVRQGRVYVRTIEGLKRADVILRRVDADFIDPLELNNSSRLGTPGMMEAIRSGGVAVVNILGSGVLESRALLGFLPRICSHFLGEELKLPHVATWWCGQPGARAFVKERLHELVIAPSFPGLGQADALKAPSLLSDMSEANRADTLARLEDRPFDLVGQEWVRLSTMPALRGGKLVAAPFVLRVYACAGPDGIKVMPGGFCRTSERSDARAIFMGEDAETADVWVLSDGPVERVTLLADKDEVAVRRLAGRLPSRAADNLFWLGRYLERAEATLRLVRSLRASLMDPEQGAHAAGLTLTALEELLIEWGALDASTLGAGAAEAAHRALYNRDTYGSVISLILAAQRTASGMRERLSPDFWTLLGRLEEQLSENAASSTTPDDALTQTEAVLRVLAALSGLAQENMNRSAGWRFLDLGRRLERGINTCQWVRILGIEAATTDDLDLLLDLIDSQITYRARYLVGLALTPVRDMAMLDPFNTRSVAFQILKVKEHLEALPSLAEDGMIEAPRRLAIALAAEIEIADAKAMTPETVNRLEGELESLSLALADRYFQQGAQATPKVKMTGLA